MVVTSSVVDEELLNVVTSIPFLSLLLYSVSSTVLTVFVEFPSTKPKEETADFPWLVNFDAIRNLKRDFDFGVTTCNEKNGYNNIIDLTARANGFI